MVSNLEKKWNFSKKKPRLLHAKFETMASTKFYYNYYYH